MSAQYILAVIAGNVTGHDRNYCNAEDTIKLIRENLIAHYNENNERLATDLKNGRTHLSIAA